MHGLDWYDFHARQYDPVLNRFHTIDPLAEKKPWLTPYHYCSNNPANRVDPDGKWDFPTWDEVASGAEIVAQTFTPIRPANQDETAVIESRYGKSNDPVSDLKRMGQQIADLPGDISAGVSALVNKISSTSISDITNKISNADGKSLVQGVGTIAITALSLKNGKVNTSGLAKMGMGSSNSVVGTTIKEFTKHGLDRAIERGIKPSGIIDAVKNPIKTGIIKTDALGRTSQRFTGSKTEVVLNPTNGKVVSVNPTSTKKVKNLLDNK